MVLSSGYMGNNDGINITHHDYIWINYIIRNNSLDVFSNAVLDLGNQNYAPRYLGYLVLGL